MAASGWDYVMPGLGLVSSLAGLFGQSAAAKRAQEARQRALTDAALAMSQEEQAMRHGGSIGLQRYAGGLGDALGSQGRALGSAGAEAGVYDSTAVGGLLSNQARANTSSISRYAEDLAGELERTIASNRGQLAGMQYGAASSDLGAAQAGEANSASGIAAAMAMLPQILKGSAAPMPKGGTVDRVASVLGSQTQRALTLSGSPDSATTLFGKGVGFGGTGMMPVAAPGLVGGYTSPISRLGGAGLTPSIAGYRSPLQFAF